MSGRIVIFAIGTRGDTEPCVALGRGLQQRGYRVRVVAYRYHAELVTGAGLEHIPLDLDPRLIFQDPDGQAWLNSEEPDTFPRGFQQAIGPIAERLLPQAEAACTDAQAIIGPSLMGAIGYHLGERYGIPCAFHQVWPLEPTQAFPAPALSAGRPLPGLGNEASYGYFEQMNWQMLGPFVNRWRQESLGLPPIPDCGPWPLARRQGLPALCYFSPTVVPRPPDWPSYVHATGYWQLDDAADYIPPPVLVDFLAAGPPPVYVGFGSMIPRAPVEVGRIVRAALRRAGVRGVLQGDWAESSDEDLLLQGDISHDWLFARCAAVVHHGGSGTTGTALRAGAPNVVCPFFFDQPFWGARVAALGAGPGPLPIKQVRVEALAEAIGRAVSDPRMRATAAALGRKLRAERGVEHACDVIEAWLRDPVLPGRGLA